MSEPLVELRGVSRIYSHAKTTHMALDTVDLRMEAGEIRTVVGPSGSGKTTLLQILGLLDSPTSGRQFFAGIDVSTLGEKERTRLRAQSIAFMFQENWLIPWLSAWENVLAPQVHLGRTTASHRLQARELLERLGLERFCDQRVTELSGGQRQRVCLARALLKSPSLVVADEPSASLDSQTTAEVLDLLLDLRQRHGFAMVVATHDPAVMGPLSSSLLRLCDGRIEL